jgi:hypothetical protein
MSINQEVAGHANPAITAVGRNVFALLGWDARRIFDV